MTSLSVWFIGGKDFTAMIRTFCNQSIETKRLTGLIVNLSTRATAINIVRTKPERTNTSMSVLHIVENSIFIRRNHASN